MASRKYVSVCGVKIGEIVPEKRGRLTPIGVPFMRKEMPFVVCVCDCGKVAVASLWHMKSGHAASCGCYHEERRVEAKTTHGKCRTPEHSAWAAMKQRCTDRNCSSFHRYGGRGIAVCDEWINSFDAFLLDMGPRPSARHSLDRKDNNLGYSKDNCRWATHPEQCSNRSTSVVLEFYGKRMSITEWSAISQVPASAVYSRISRGWPPKVAMWAPIGARLKDLSWVRVSGVSTNG